MNKIFKVLTIWFVLGMIYFVIEGLWRIPKGGYANIVMLPIGGFCGLIVGSINQMPMFYKMAVWKQAVIGTVLTLIIEYITGYILNIKLGLKIWDYSNMALNLNGQICLTFGFVWFLIMPAAIWLEDYIRFRFWGEGEKYGLKDIYREFVYGK